MTTIAVAFCLAFLCSLILTRVVMALAVVLGAVDRPNGLRKLHGRPVPLGGGIAIFVAFAVPVISLLAMPQLSTVADSLWQNVGRLRLIYTCGALALVLGMLDDVLDLKPGWKLAGQTLVGVGAYAGGLQIRLVGNPFGPPLDLGIFALPATILWFLGCMNAVNLLDGLDGLAAGVSVFVAVAMFVVSLQYENILAMFLMACLAGAALGFLIYNFPPARIFLGDGGSQLLGFLIGSLSLTGVSRKAETAVMLFIPVVALGLPIIDTAVAIVRRWYKRLPVSAPDRQHIHHLLVAMGYSHRRVVMTLYLVTVTLGAVAVFMAMSRSEIVVLLLGAFMVVGFVAVRVFSGVRLRDVALKMLHDRELREWEAESRLAVERAKQLSLRAQDFDVVWRIFCGALQRMGMGWARLTLVGGVDSEAEAMVWEREGEEIKKGIPVWSATVPLWYRNQMIGELVMGCRLRPGDSGRIFPELVHELGSVLAGAVGRLIYSRPSGGEEKAQAAPESG